MNDAERTGRLGVRRTVGRCEGCPEAPWWWRACHRVQPSFREWARQNAARVVGGGVGAGWWCCRAAGVGAHAGMGRIQGHAARSDAFQCVAPVPVARCLHPNRTWSGSQAGRTMGRAGPGRRQWGAGVRVIQLSGLRSPGLESKLLVASVRGRSSWSGRGRAAPLALFSDARESTLLDQRLVGHIPASPRRGPSSSAFVAEAGRTAERCPERRPLDLPGTYLGGRRQRILRKPAARPRGERDPRSLSASPGPRPGQGRPFSPPFRHRAVFTTSPPGARRSRCTPSAGPSVRCRTRR